MAMEVEEFSEKGIVSERHGIYHRRGVKPRLRRWPDGSAHHSHMCRGFVSECSFGIGAFLHHTVMDQRGGNPASFESDWTRTLTFRALH